MMTSFASSAMVDGVAFVGYPGSPGLSPRAVLPAPDPLERLLQIGRSNDRLLEELAAARRRVGQALAYAGDPESWSPLGAALVAHARRQRSRVLDQLRANRSAAIAILAGLAPRD